MMHSINSGWRRIKRDAWEPVGVGRTGVYLSKTKCILMGFRARAGLTKYYLFFFRLIGFKGC
jgi:hypothetical protein